jgi:hypothetical protein
LFGIVKNSSYICATLKHLEIMKNYVGRKCKGFKFKDETDGVRWFSSMMKKHMGEIGIIKYQGDGYVVIQFQDNNWSYPIDLIEPHLIPETPEIPQLGDDVEELADLFSIDETKVHPADSYIAKLGFIEGHKSATKVLYSEEDLRKAIEETISWWEAKPDEKYGQINTSHDFADEFIQSLKLQKSHSI